MSETAILTVIYSQNFRTVAISGAAECAAGARDAPQDKATPSQTRPLTAKGVEKIK